MSRKPPADEPYWSLAEAVAWIEGRDGAREAGAAKWSPPQPATLAELHRLCRVGKVQAIGQRCPPPPPPFSDGREMIRAMHAAAHPAGPAERISAYEWARLEWRRNTAGAPIGDLKPARIDWPAWSQVLFRRKDVGKCWPRGSDAIAGRQRGRPGWKKARVIALMQEQLGDGTLSRDQLRDMKGVEGEALYRVGRTTFSEARRRPCDCRKLISRHFTTLDN